VCSNLGYPATLCLKTWKGEKERGRERGSEEEKKEGRKRGKKEGREGGREEERKIKLEIGANSCDHEEVIDASGCQTREYSTKTAVGKCVFHKVLHFIYFISYLLVLGMELRACFLRALYH
jgi:hypothetical protein